MNSNTLVLTYICDPFGIRDPIFCLNDGSEAVEVDFNTLIGTTGNILTFELGILIDGLRRLNASELPSLLDLSDALRMRCGRPKDEVGEKPWNVWRQVARASSTDRVNSIESIFHSRTAWPDRLIILQELRWLSFQIYELWKTVQQDLDNQDEIERFFQVEAPVRRTLNGRQLVGIKIDQDRLLGFIKKVEAEKYQAFLQIAPKIGRSPQSINYWNLGDCLGNTELEPLSGIDDAGSMRDALKLSSNYSEFARSLVSYLDAVRDEATLKRCAGSMGTVHPFFHAHGTVTGRILVSEPSLQQLRSKYRAIVAPNPGCSLAYLDYAQFEPGVVAQLSGDPSFIDAYNKGDLYAALSTRLYGAPDHRKQCKQIFLAYCYGMQRETIVRLMLPASATPQDIEKLSSGIEGFFSEFPGLEHLRRASEDLLGHQGWISSAMGNRRYRGGSGVLSHKERRWALNQRIQATASLIFKEAVTTLTDAFGWQAFVLPMHDAALLEVPATARRDEFVATATGIMENALARRLPDIKPKVVCGDFSGEA